MPNINGLVVEDNSTKDQRYHSSPMPRLTSLYIMPRKKPPPLVSPGNMRIHSAIYPAIKRGFGSPAILNKDIKDGKVERIYIALASYLGLELSKISHLRIRQTSTRKQTLRHGTPRVKVTKRLFSFCSTKAPTLTNKAEETARRSRQPRVEATKRLSRCC